MKFMFAPEATPLSGYTIKRAIDRGGFGEVYYALSDSGKEVALKLLQRNQQVELRGVSQCLNLKHPNLVTIFDIKTDNDGDHWVIMEFVSGKSLEAVLADYPRGLPLDEVEAWLSGIAAGTAFLHDRGIVHRDLKPANVFRESGIVKIGDVGLSKFITPSRRSAQTESVGTVYYMAPEVARGKYGSELDVYSMGVMLYEMLTGAVPFTGESTGEILMKHMTEPPDLSKVPATFREVVGRALHKDPQRRTPGAARLLDEFRAARQGKPVAVDIPASHFVNVPEIERKAAVRPEPMPAGYGPRVSDATIHYAADGSPRAGQGPRPHSPGSPPPLANPFGNAMRNFGEGLNHLGDWVSEKFRKRPWLFSIVAVLLVVNLSRGAGLFGGRGGINIGGTLALMAIIYFTVKTVADKKQNSGAGRRSPGVPPMPTVAPVAQVTPPPPPVTPPKPPVKPAGKKNAPALTPATLRSIPWTRRASDLTGAMTMAVIWGALATALLTVLRFPIAVDQERALLATHGGLGLWGLVTILGSWALLGSSKVLEGSAIGNQNRRLIQTAIGAAVGAIAFALQHELLVDLPIHSSFDGLFNHIGRLPLTTDVSVDPDTQIRFLQPTLAGYVVYFGALFGFRRWWLLADSFRVKRFSIFSVIFSGFIAFLIPAAFVFQQNWGAMWGVAIATVVQLSAPWIAPAKRAVPPAAEPAAVAA
ncbi:MAG: serine/threonine protein kinase [Planctomycetes bacterium]|nr:serine/threonine protein kinase [Planctomycetota bacterium]